jgi:hypothetical protein
MTSLSETSTFSYQSSTPNETVPLDAKARQPGVVFDAFLLLYYYFFCVCMCSCFPGLVVLLCLCLILVSPVLYFPAALSVKQTYLLFFSNMTFLIFFPLSTFHTSLMLLALVALIIVVSLT